MAKIHTEPMSGCWLWVGSVERGYGKMGFSGKREPAHRLAYKAFVGPIPDGLVIDHLCATSLCVNPDHLEAVTTQENGRRGRHGHAHASVSAGQNSAVARLRARVIELETQMLTIIRRLDQVA